MAQNGWRWGWTWHPTGLRTDSLRRCWKNRMENDREAVWTQQPAMRQLPSDLGRPQELLTRVSVSPPQPWGRAEALAVLRVSMRGEPGKASGREPVAGSRGNRGTGLQAPPTSPRLRSPAGSPHLRSGLQAALTPATPHQVFCQGDPRLPTQRAPGLEAPRGPGLSLWPTRLLSPGPVPSSYLKAPVSTIVSFPPKLIHFLTHSRYLNVPTCNTSGQISRAGPPCDKATRGDPGALTATVAAAHAGAARRLRAAPGRAHPAKAGPCSPPSPEADLETEAARSAPRPAAQPVGSSSPKRSRRRSAQPGGSQAPRRRDGSGALPPPSRGRNPGAAHSSRLSLAAAAPT